MSTAATWMEQAACSSADPELFFLPRTDHHTAQALAICHWCPVRSECLSTALAEGHVDGIWGGLTETALAAAHQTVPDRTELVR